WPWGRDARGGVVPVALHHGRQVPRVPRGPVQVIVVLGLLLLPHVERLVQHDEAHAVGEIEQLGGGRVVRRTQRVVAHVPHDLQLLLQCSCVHRCTTALDVVMRVTATYYYILAM